MKFLLFFYFFNPWNYNPYVYFHSVDFHFYNLKIIKQISVGLWANNMYCQTLKEKINEVLSSLRLTFVFIISVKLGCIFPSTASHNFCCRTFSSLVEDKIMIHLTLKGLWDLVKHNGVLPFHSFCHQDIFHRTLTVLKNMLWRTPAQEMLYLNKTHIHLQNLLKLF